MHLVTSSSIASLSSSSMDDCLIRGSFSCSAPRRLRLGADCSLRDMASASSIDSDLCVEPRPSDTDLFIPLRTFLESFRVVIEEEEEFACEGAVGCCEDRAREDLLGDILDEARDLLLACYKLLVGC